MGEERPAVYIISNKANSKRYVGKAINGAEKRWARHKRDAERGVDTLFYRAIRKYGEDSFHVVGKLELGEGFTAGKTKEQINEALKTLEIIQIRISGTADPSKGYNMTEGGEGLSGFTHSQETRKKMSVSAMGNTRNLGHRHSAESLAKMGVVQSGKIISLETREKLRIANLGKKRSDNVRAKMSAARSGEKHHRFGKHHSSEAKEKLRAANLGKKASPETVAKLRVANSGENNGFFGKRHSMEARLKMRAAKAGKKLSVEHKAKISISLKGINTR
jgi:group I intron endonuclease